MPAEWERHEATWLTWPKDPTTFPPSIMHNVEQAYVEMIEELASGERIDLLVDNQRSAERVSQLLATKENVVFHKITTADVWVRDYGPIFVKKKDGIAVTKWIFNAWGNKYDELKPDDISGMKIAQSTRLRVFEPGLVLEGGSIEVNGHGTGITTKQCLMNSNRNPNLNQSEIACSLKEYLGIENLIWLERGIAGDDTDGHVDDVARFVDENTVLYMTEDKEDDDNCQALQKNAEILSEAKDQNGRKINLIPIKMPKSVNYDGSRLPASYANFYIGNSVVLVPTYGDSHDSTVVDSFKHIFTDRRVVGIDCRSLVYGLGAIHCVTQQQPQ